MASKEWGVAGSEPVAHAATLRFQALRVGEMQQKSLCLWGRHHDDSKLSVDGETAQDILFF